MRIKGNDSGYTMWLSKNDTYYWADGQTTGDRWPCSTVCNKSIRVDVDSNGLCDIAVNGKMGDDIDGVELDAIVSDHLPKEQCHLWPVWGQK